MTLLHLAAYKGHYDIVTVVYEQYNANIVYIDNVSYKHQIIYYYYYWHKIITYDFYIQVGDTPLHDACRNGFANIIYYLLSKHADTTIFNNRDETPADALKPDIENREEILKRLKNALGQSRYLIYNHTLYIHDIMIFLLLCLACCSFLTWFLAILDHTLTSESNESN